MTRRSLHEILHSKESNNLDFVRVFAALLVLFGHSFTLILSSPANIFPHDPITLLIIDYIPFSESLPGIGLHIFFFVSGLLVSLSFTRNKGNPLNFCVSRALRIIPAYAFCVLFLAIALGPWLTKLDLSAYFSNSGLVNFVQLHLTFRGLPGLPGVFAENPFGAVVNGSLWTIPHELQLYAWVLVLGLFSFLRNRIFFLIFFITLLTIYCISGKSHVFFGVVEVPRLWIFFFFGILASVYAEKLVISPRWLALTLLPLAIFWQTGNAWLDIVGAAWFCYAILIFSFYRYFPAIDVGRIGDFSYGIYLYAFPVQQTLIHFFKASLNGWSLAFFALLATIPLAVFSWYVVEKPALRFKRSQGIAPQTALAKP